MSWELREQARRREEERESAERRRAQFEADIKAVAARPEGKRLLGWLLDQGGIYAEDWCPDAVTAAYQSGKRGFALKIWNLLHRHLSRAAFVEVILPGETEDGKDRMAGQTGQQEE